MASAVLPIPGTEYGPCETECAHIDCAKTREMAAKRCRFCGEIIGFDRHFYDDDAAGAARGDLVHASCLETSVLGHG